MPVLSYFFAPHFFPTSSLAQTHTHTTSISPLERTSAGNPFCPTFSRLPYLAKQSCFSRDRPSHAASPPPASWLWCGRPRPRTPVAFVFRPRWRLPNAENLASSPPPSLSTPVCLDSSSPHLDFILFLRCLHKTTCETKRERNSFLLLSFLLLYPRRFCVTFLSNFRFG